MKTALENLIKEKIKGNANQEITGQSLQDVLLSMVATMYDDLELSMEGYVFQGLATVKTVPAVLSSDADKRFYLAVDDGLYSNFTGLASAPITTLSIIRNTTRNYWESLSLNIPLNFELTSELGDSVRKVMTQKAVTQLYNEGYKYAGIAHTNDKVGPLTGSEKVFYIITEEGDYSNYSLGTISELSVIKSLNRSWSAEGLGMPLNIANDIITAQLYPGGYTSHYYNNNSGFKEVARFYLEPEYKYQLKIMASEAILKNAYYVSGLYEENGTRLVSASLAMDQSESISDILQVNERKLVILKSELEIPFNWTITVDSEIRVSKIEDYSKSPLLEGFLSGSTDDYNSYISEIYIEPPYTSGFTSIALRAYNKGIILKEFPNKRWSINNYNIFDGKKNGDIIPLVVTSATDTAHIGKTIGYAIFKDISGFKSLPDDTGDGQKINMGVCTKLFTQPAIWESLRIVKNSNTPEPVNNQIKIYLPQQIEAVVGDTLQLFFRSIVDIPNISMYDVTAVCNKGKSYPRYWEYKPTSEDAGKTAKLKVIVRDKADSIIATKESIVKFVASRTSPLSNINVLCIGASATEGGQWVGELKRRLIGTDGDGTPANPQGLGLSNFTFVGRKQGKVNHVNLEATGGWKVATYGSKGERAYRLDVNNVNQLYIGDTYTSPNGGVFVIQEINVTEGIGNIRCTFNSSVPTISASGTLTRTSGNGDATIQYSSYSDEYYSPFFNTTTNKIDFKTYANDWCNGSIDLMIWHCGVNDIFSGTDTVIDTAISTFENILKQFHIDFPNGKVIISSVPLGSMNGGFAANYGASEIMNSLTFMNQAQKYSERLQALVAKYSSYAFYSPVMEEFDSEYGYPTKTTAVNNRVALTETIGTNAVHPTDSGSYMVADAIYRTINTMSL